MITTSQKYILPSSFNLLENWSVQYLLESSFSYNEKYSLVRISDFLTRNKTAIDIDNEKWYKRVTIKIKNGGVFIRDTEIGKKIGTKKQFLVKKGQFLLSKIDARNGAFGVVPEELDGAIITGNFWTFDVDYSKINPHFLSLITTTAEFRRFSENASNGTTNRHYLQENLFLKVKIPLPSIEEQNRIVENYNNKVEQSLNMEKEADKLENQIGHYFDEIIGINFDIPVEWNANYAVLNFVKYSTFDKWGVDKQIKISRIQYTKGFPAKRIIELCTVGSGGTPSRNRKDYYHGDIPWVKTTEVKNELIVETEEKITQEALANSSAKVYSKGSLIIAMYGQGATRGRTAKLGIDSSTNQACTVLSNINNSEILTDYLWLYLINEYDRLRAMASGNNQPNLNGQMIKDYLVIIPPKSIQEEIIATVAEFKFDIKKLRHQAESNRHQAIQEFENEIFKPCN